MKLNRLAGVLAVALSLVLAPARAAEQSSIVMPLVGPMSMGTHNANNLNPALRAIASCSWGSSAPANGPGSAPIAYQCWADTTSNPVVFKRYDGTSWVTFGKLNTSTHAWTPTFQGTDLGTASIVNLGSNVGTWLATPSSANLAAALTDETGTGANVFANSPTLVTPNLGTPSAVTLTNGTGLPISTGVSGLGTGIAAFLATPSSANLRAALTDETGTGIAYFVGGALGTPASATLTNATGLPISTGVSGLGTGVSTFLATPSSANLAAALTDETGTGANVFANSPTLVTPNLGTPSAATLTNATGLPVSTGISGLGTGVATALATPSSANIAAAVTDETGSGALVFGTSPALTTPNLGTPSAATLTNATGLPVSTGISGLGTGIATFLATPSSANLRAALTDETGTGVAYFVGGALGTPASGILTNATGLPVSTGVSGLGTGVATALATPSSANWAAALTDETGSGAAVFATAPAIVNADLQGKIRFSSFVTATAIGANQNDYTATDGSNTCATRAALRLSATGASRNVTGLSCSQAEGDIKIIHNVGSQNIVLTNQDAASTAANRFLFGGDVTLVADYSITIKYDAVTSRWRAITTASAGGGGGVTSVSVAADEGIQVSGTCTITTSGTCTAALSDSYRQNLQLDRIYGAKAYVGYRRVINAFADGYKASDGVNSGSSSNYVVDTTNGRLSASVGTTVTINSNSGTTAYGGIVTFVDRTTQVLNSQTVYQIGVYSTAAATFAVKIALRNSAGNYTIAYTQSFSHPGGGWADCILTSPYSVPGSGTYFLAVSNTSNPANNDSTVNTVTRAFVTGDQSGTSGSYTEGTGTVPPMRYGYGVGNITLVTTAQTADSSVSNARVLLEFDNSATPTLNSDITVEVTCNGGTNWASASLSSVSTNGQNGRKVVETVDQACTAGTSFAARIKTFNNKSIPIHGLSLTVH